MADLPIRPAPTSGSPLADALVRFQDKVPKLGLDSEANITASRKYKYISLAKLMEVVRPVLNECGLAVIQKPSMVFGTNGEMIPALRTKILHVSGEYEEEVMPLMLDKNDPQGQGSAITYARRYALMSFLGLVADEDDDGLAATPRRRGPAKPKEEPKSEPEPVDLMPQLTSALAAVSKWDNWSRANVLNQANLAFNHEITKLEDMTPDEMQTIIDGAHSWLEAHLDDDSAG